MTMKTSAIAIVAAAGALALAGCSASKGETQAPAATASDSPSDAASAVSTAETVYHATLSGANETKGGDPDGSGTATITISDGYGKVCWDLQDIKNIGPIKAAHVHMGAAGADGAPVFPLHASATGEWKGCEDGSAWAKNRIDGNPQDFYVNVHTAEFPAGAIRGQLGS
ncbi:CHRD domain-containing protein [Tsuneonella mangrovi]|uniref:CHRD domain-containing protein n=1 Tax=Tsuneonella mangrovi TaxID=1982042 RepID=UPI001F0AA4BA|nr:CHRD domain-containing protein [Tsuneonella mangrovi]